MKATIDQHGTLILEPESGLEVYALSSWVDSKKDFVVYAYVEQPSPARPAAHGGSLRREEQTQ